MKNEKRLIDANALIAKCDAPHWCVWMSEIDDTPTVDAVEVVRCKDCKYRRNDINFVTGHYCVKRPSNGGYYCDDNDFCSYGERA